MWHTERFHSLDSIRDKERQELWTEREMGHNYAERTCAVEIVMSEEMTETVEHY